MSIIGRRVGNVRIVELIGEGGMGRVYRGVDERLERTVAVKTLRSAHRLRPDARIRILREARILSKLDHDNICRIFDLIDHDDADHLILEYVEGRTLSKACRGKPQSEVLENLLQITDALSVAHAEGIVHRDLKPENVLVTRDGRVKILDFGIARSMDAPIIRRPTAPTGKSQSQPTIGPAVPEDDATEGLQTYDERSEGHAGSERSLLTRQGALVGTIAYMSPEQAGGGDIAPASDMYSFGIMVQEILTGRRPYGDDSGTDLLLRVFRADNQRVEGIDAELAELITGLTALDPETRPTATATADKLRWILGREQRQRKRRIRLWLASAVAAIVFVATGFAVSSRIEAGRREQAAQRFTAEAKDLEWRMRAEYLSQPHDLRPARRQVLEKIEVIEKSLTELGDYATGPGHYAIGRSLMALRDYDTAKNHLDAAWYAGYRVPEVALSLGITYTTLYQQSVLEGMSLTESDDREAALGDARKDLGQPALEFLQYSQPDGTLFPDYVQALVAIIDERYDEAYELALRSSGGVPWFYAGDILAARTRLTQAERLLSVEGDFEEAIAIRREVVDLLEDAVGKARSDPEILALACRTLQAITTSYIFAIQGGLEETSTFLELSKEATNRLEAVDPESKDFFTYSILRLQATAFHEVQSRRDPEPVFLKAMKLASEATRVHPDEAWPSWLRGKLGTAYTWYLNYVGRDARPVLDQALVDYTNAESLDEADADGSLTLATTYFYRAVQENRYGGDPTAWTRNGAAAAERCLKIEAENLTCTGMLGNLSFMEGLYAMNHGLEGEVALEKAVEAHQRQAAMKTNAEALSNLALDLCQLGQYRISRGKPAGDTFERALTTIEGIPEDQRSAHTHGVEGLAYRCIAQQHGLTTDDLRHAVAAYERAIQLENNRIETYVALAETHNAGAGLAVGSGNDPTEYVTAATKVIDTALEREPDHHDLLLIRGEVGLHRAQWEAENGRSPMPTLTRCQANIEESLGGCSDPARAFSDLAEVFLHRALWKVYLNETPETDIISGLEAAEKALDVNSKLAEAKAVKTRLQSIAVQ